MKRLLLLIYFINLAFCSAQTYEIQEVKLVAKLQTLIGLNEKTEEFSPVMLGNKLYFTSTRPYNKHNIGENNWDKNGYSNVFYGTIRNDEEGVVEIRDIKLLSNKLNVGNHTGPISFTKNGDTLFFTRVVQIKEGGQQLFKPQLFSAIRKNDTWTKVRRLPFSDLKDSYAHPSYDPQNNRLYFVSDKPGGKGNYDIYYSKVENGNWTAPINLEMVNSVADEKFPYVINGNVFFSSDRAGGQGQLDIYYSSPEPTNYPIILDGLNTPYDDFGISILPDLSAGYYSSNRSGNDDIYYFTVERKITVKNQLAGVFTFRSLAATASNLTVQLFNENGEFIYEEKTDTNGYFLFDNVRLDSNFSVRLAGVARDELTLEFYNETGETEASFILSEEGAFKYKKLFYEKNGIIEFIPEDMKDFSLNTAKLSGKLVFEKALDEELANQIVNLIDSDQNIRMSTITDAFGNFQFDSIGLATNYTLQIPNCQDDLILFIYGANDQIFTQLKCNTRDQFMYRRLRPDLSNNLSLIENEEMDIFMVNSAEISGNFSPTNKNTRPIKCKIRVYSENGLLLETTSTDSLGNFKFTSLNAEKTYKFTADTHVPLALTLYDRYGKQVAKIQEEENNYYIYRPLGFQSNSNLSLTDDLLSFNLNQSEKYNAVMVYFNSNEAKVMDAGLDDLNSILKLMKKFPQIKLSISAYADATASEEYNFILSQKRGEWIANYLISKGIDPKRLTINAYGETKLIDPENDSINRRAELRIYL